MGVDVALERERRTVDLESLEDLAQELWPMKGCAPARRKKRRSNGCAAGYRPPEAVGPPRRQRWPGNPIATGRTTAPAAPLSRDGSTIAHDVQTRSCAIAARFRFSRL